MPFQLRRLQDFGYRRVCVRRAYFVIDLSYPHIELHPQRVPSGRRDFEVLTIDSLVVSRGE